MTRSAPGAMLRAPNATGAADEHARARHHAVESLVTTTHVVYALHTLGLVIGAFGTATIIGTFLFGWPSIIAVIINYVKRSDVRGTWLESHFSWQIRTFWWAMLWAVHHRSSSARCSAIVLVGFAIWISASSCSASGRSTASPAAGCD